MADELLADQVIGSGDDTGAPVAPQIDAPASPEPRSQDEQSPKKMSIREGINAAIKEEQAKVDKTGRLHGEGGKSAPKPKDTAEAAPQQAAPANESPKTEKDAQPADGPKPSGPPPGWSAESKALWDTLPQAVKADALKREADVEKGFEKHRPKLAQYEALEQVIAPHRAAFQRSGAPNDAAAIHNALSWVSAVQANPVQGLLAAAQHFGIDPSTLAQSSSRQPPEGQQDFSAQLQPVIAPVVQDVRAVQQEVQSLRAERITSELATFAKDKPHFEKVRVTMGQLIQSGAAEGLEDAYQKAIWANPETREQLVREQAQKAADDAIKAATQRSQQARAAAISPSGRTPGSQVNGSAIEKPKGVRGSLLASIKELREGDRA